MSSLQVNCFFAFVAWCQNCNNFVKTRPLITTPLWWQVINVQKIPERLHEKFNGIKKVWSSLKSEWNGFQIQWTCHRQKVINLIFIAFAGPYCTSDECIWLTKEYSTGIQRGEEGLFDTAFRSTEFMAVQVNSVSAEQLIVL